MDHLAQPPAIVAIDGDTIRVGNEVARLIGFDAPETVHAKCARERRLGLQAKARLAELIRGGRTAYLPTGRRDRYGRALATLRVDGVDVGTILIRERLARAYAGGRRQGWCR